MSNLARVEVGDPPRRASAFGPREARGRIVGRPGQMAMVQLGQAAALPPGLTPVTTNMPGGTRS